MTSSLRPLRILLTASGCPGASTCIQYLQGIKERKISVVGVDSDPEAIGRFFAGAFYPVPPSSSPEYIPSLLEIADKEAVDLLIPASSYDVETVSRSITAFEEKGVRVLVSKSSVLKTANNKHALYETLRTDSRVKIPRYKLVKSLAEFHSALNQLGYPENQVCFKPPYSKGSRGFRYLAAGIDRADLLLNHKPDNKMISLEEFEEIFSKAAAFPELLVMEIVKGEEIDSMVLGWQGEALLMTHKTRESERGGVITRGELVRRPEIEEAIRAIVAKVPLEFNFGIQFIDGSLIEINPRLSTFIYTRDFVEPYFAVKLALGEMTPEQVRGLQTAVPYGLRMVRYFDQSFFYPGKTSKANLSCAE